MATILETILSFPGLDDSENYIRKILVDRSVNGAATYKKDSKDIVNLCAADAYSMLGGNVDFMENKLSVTHPRSWYISMARNLYTTSGEPEKAQSLNSGITIPKGRTGGC